MQARWAVVIGLVAACSDARTLVLPPLAGTAGVVVLFDTKIPSAVGVELDRAPAQVEVPADARETVVAYYPASLASLGLPSGPFSSEAESALRLPAASALRSAGIMSPAQWIDASAAPPTLFTAFRLPEETPESCFGRGGCFVEGRCGAPCTVDRPSLPSIDPFPTPPSFAPCPTGWDNELVEVTALEGQSTSFSVCQPFVSTTSCSAGQEHFLGRGCAAVDACPVEDWPAVASGPGVRFVQPGGAGDGQSQATPLPGIAEAIAAGATTVVLSRGRFPTSVELGNDVTIKGVCAAKTVLVPAGPQVFRVSGAILDLSHLSIRGGDPQIDALGAAELRMSAVHLSGAPSRAVWIKDGSRARITNSAIVESGFVALSAESSSVSLDGSVIRDIRGDAAVFGDRSSTLSVNRSAILFTGADRVQGLVTLGKAKLSASAIKGAAWHGIFSPRGASLLELSDVVVQDIAVDPTREEHRGYGITVDGAELIARRVLIERTVGSGLSLHFHATGTIQDLVVREVSKATEDHTDGLYLFDGSTAVVQRAFLRDVMGSAVDIGNGGARGELTDLFAVGGQFENLNARGIYIGVDASALVRRAYVARNASGGVALLSPTAVSTTLVDVVIESNGTSGLWINDQRSVDLERVLFRANAEEAILVGDPPDFPTLSGRDITVLGSAQLGVVHSSGTLDLRRFSIEDASLAGVALGTEMGATLHDGLVQGNAVGVKALRTVDLSQVLEHVRFLGNQRNVAVE